MVKEEKIITKQRNDMERIIALALIKNLYNQGKISEFVFRNIEVIQRRKFHCQA